jgi:hypothetical protein
MSLVTITQRFCGPPASGNGGYSCGLLAEAFDGDAVEVTLRAPPPLQQPLRIERSGDQARLWQDDLLIAEALRTELELTPPAPPSLAQATAATTRYGGLHDHRYPTCFACGTQREPGDGLRLFTGATHPGQSAAPWTPDPSLAGADGRHVRSPVLWAAIDCAGYWAFSPDGSTSALLGRMAAHFVRDVEVGEPCIVTGWLIAEEGRKRQTGTALFAADGHCIGVARQTWVVLKN